MISENLYIQYFLGFESFTSETPFDSSLFVEIRKRMGVEQLNRINDVIYNAAMGKWDDLSDKEDNGSDKGNMSEQSSGVESAVNDS